ncbi:MAG: hypothetical protein AB7G06_00135 [Bdellovibrionales bacterium]
MTKQPLTVLAIAAISVGLMGCGATFGNPSSAAYAIQLNHAAVGDVCADFRAGVINKNEAQASAAFKELRKRRIVSAATGPDAAYFSPPAGATEAEVLCLWAKPSEIAKRIAKDGVVEDVYSYEHDKQSGAALTGFNEELIFRNGKLTRVERSSL